MSSSEYKKPIIEFTPTLERLTPAEQRLWLSMEQGFDPKFGARPLRRLLQEKIENIIANKILAGELKRRDTVVINTDAEVLVEKGREL